jgi:eukaryotic-like serine/threonine-protein kinase
MDLDALPVIGAGRVATVRVLHRSPDGSPMAVKVYPGPMDPFTRNAFERERAAFDALPAIASILRVDDVLYTPDGRPGLGMELCAQSLAQLLDRHGPLALPDSLAIGRAVATALAAAHGAGLVHGAVTPHNVLLRASGEPVLADFGLALRRGYPHRPVTAWVAPETLRHNEVTERSDLYGLGAVLRTALAYVPRSMRGLLSRLLAADPADRPASAAGVLAELEAAAADPPGEFDDFPQETEPRPGDRFFADWERGDPDPEPPARPRRHPMLGAAAALAVLVAVPVLAGRQPSPAAESPRPAEIAAAPASGVTVHTVDLQLDTPVEAGDSVQLSWRSDADLEYAVVVAGTALPTKVVLVNREHTLRVPVEPDRQYCFLVQGTDGAHVYQTAPRPIRGAVCRQ